MVAAMLTIGGMGMAGEKWIGIAGALTGRGEAGGVGGGSAKDRGR